MEEGKKVAGGEAAGGRSQLVTIVKVAMSVEALWSLLGWQVQESSNLEVSTSPSLGRSWWKNMEETDILFLLTNIRPATSQDDS
jgi:hypothetical protein